MNEIHESCKIGYNSNIINSTLYRNVEVGDNCVVGPYALIEPGVKIGNNTRIKSHTFICEGVTIGDRVFVSHGVIFCNEKWPKANREEKWELSLESKVFVEDDVAIGSGAVILPGVTIKKSAMIGAGAVVTRDVNEKSVMIGVPAREYKGDGK